MEVIYSNEIPNVIFKGKKDILTLIQFIQNATISNNTSIDFPWRIDISTEHGAINYSSVEEMSDYLLPTTEIKSFEVYLGSLIATGDSYKQDKFDIFISWRHNHILYLSSSSTSEVLAQEIVIDLTAKIEHDFQQTSESDHTTKIKSDVKQPDPYIPQQSHSPIPVEVSWAKEERLRMDVSDKSSEKWDKRRLIFEIIGAFLVAAVTAWLTRVLS